MSSRSRALAPALLALLVAAGPAGAVAVTVDALPSGTAVIGGEEFPLPLALGPDGKSVILDAQTPLTLLSNDPEGGTLTIRGLEGNVDPLASLSLLFTDTGTPTSLLVTLTVPLSPNLVDPVAYDAQLSGALTDAGQDGVSIGLLPTWSTVGVYEVLGSGVLALAGLGGAQGAAGAYGPFGASSASVSGGLGPYGFLRLSVGFQGSGGGDSYALASRFEVIQAGSQVVPEPATLVLLASGLAGIAARRRRRP